MTKHLHSRKSDTNPIYSRWEGMRQRCNNKNFPSYKYYGGRGISVCPEWANYKNFFEWASKNGFKPELELDRIDGNGNYEPSNCRWVESIVNKRNVSERKRNKKYNWGIVKSKNQRFSVRIWDKSSGKVLGYGSYDSEDLAIKARDYALSGGIQPKKIRPDKGIYEKSWGFLVHVVKNNRCYHVGTFKTKEEAIQKRDEFYDSL